jgi:hypothetical protein
VWIFCISFLTGCAEKGQAAHLTGISLMRARANRPCAHSCEAAMPHAGGISAKIRWR